MAVLRSGIPYSDVHKRSIPNIVPWRSRPESRKLPICIYERGRYLMGKVISLTM